MTDRCEPPPEWRDRDGWHWLSCRGWPPVPRIWLAEEGRWSVDRDGIWGLNDAYPYWRYIAPVTPHAEVAALRARVAELEEALSVLHEAAEMLLGGTGRIWGRGPEDADYYTHEPWHAEYLAKAEKTARAALDRKP